jgi:hypothetical protein
MLLQGENDMPNTAGQRAIEFHNLAAQAHLEAAASHNKGDHLSAHEQSRLAHEQSRLAQEHSAEAHRHSEQAAAQEE